MNRQGFESPRATGGADEMAEDGERYSDPSTRVKGAAALAHGLSELGSRTRYVMPVRET